MRKKNDFKNRKRKLFPLKNFENKNFKIVRKFWKKIVCIQNNQRNHFVRKEKRFPDYFLNKFSFYIL